MWLGILLMTNYHVRFVYRLERQVRRCRLLKLRFGFNSHFRHSFKAWILGLLFNFAGIRVLLMNIIEE
ncbi:hypothetical protein HMPREF1170_02123 [Aeromonas veronii AMC35]|nr:hypothetical protein HMPREF1170_02123 [Aeromonas veronii AMC35]